MAVSDLFALVVILGTILGTSARVIVVVIAIAKVPPSERAEVLNAVAQILRYWGRGKR